jgi:hypothetical protein
MQGTPKRKSEHVSLDVFVNPDVYEPDNCCGFYTADNWRAGNSDDCKQWRDEGKTVLRTGEDKTFQLNLYAPDPSLTFSYVANFCRAPGIDHDKAQTQTPLDDQTVRNPSGNAVGSDGEQVAFNKRTYYRYPLVKDAAIKNAGTYFVTLYAKIESGQGAGKVFACDPEMQVEEREDGGGPK